MIFGLHIYHLLLLTTLFMYGCDIFQTRSPESPSQPSSIFVQPTTHDIVITNFKNSIIDYNIDNYIRCLVDENVSDKTFEFIPAQDSRIDVGIFRTWNRESEKQYLLNIGKPQLGSPILLLTNERMTSVTSDSVVYNFDYDLHIPHRHTNYPTSFSGNLQFYIAADQNRNWSIYRWLDFKTNSQNTWSYLKAIFSSGL